MQKKKELWVFIKFALVGVSNTVVDSIAFYIMYALSDNQYISKVIAVMFGMTNSYLWNKFWTFNADTYDNSPARLIKFVLVNLIALGASLLVLNLTADFAVSVMTIFHLEQYAPNFANLFLAGPVSIIVNFIGNRFLVFKPKQESDDLPR